MLKINSGDIIELKKPHPCKGSCFKVIRIGSLVRIVCLTCGRDMEIERTALEKSIKKINP